MTIFAREWMAICSARSRRTLAIPAYQTWQAASSMSEGQLKALREGAARVLRSSGALKVGQKFHDFVPVRTSSVPSSASATVKPLLLPPLMHLCGPNLFCFRRSCVRGRERRPSKRPKFRPCRR